MKNAPAKRGRKIRCQFVLAPDQVAFLKKRSKSTDCTLGYLVREAIREYAARRGVKLEAEAGE